MDIGVHLPQFAPARGSLGPDRVHTVALAARDLGFAAVAANDHLAFSRPWLDGPTMLAAVAAETAPLDLVTTVALPAIRGPVQLGATLAALEVLAPGRIIAGLGPGSSRVDHALAGRDFADRWADFEEAVTTLRSLLHRKPDGPDADVLAGQVPAASVAERCVPLWLGSWGSRAGLRRVARLGDGWLASAYNTTPADFAAGRATLAHALEALDRDPSSVPAALATMWTFVTDDATEAGEALAGIAGLVGRDPDSLSGRLCIGPAAHCVEVLDRYASAGCGRVYVWPVQDEVAQLERLARDVIPFVGG